MASLFRASDISFILCRIVCLRHTDSQVIIVGVLYVLKYFDGIGRNYNALKLDRCKQETLLTLKKVSHKCTLFIYYV